MPLRLEKRAVTELWLVIAGTFVALAIVLVAAAIILDRQQTISRAEGQLRSFAELTVDHADRAIEDADKLLRGVTPEIAAWDLRDAEAGKRIFNRVRRLMEGSPQIASVWVMDMAGRDVLDSWTFPAAPVSAPDRAYFQAALHGAPDPVIDRASSGTVTNKARFTISRSVLGPAGRLHAVVVAGIYSSYFQQLYEQALTRPGIRASLLIGSGGHSTGPGVLARVGSTPAESADFDAALNGLIAPTAAGAAELSVSENRLIAWRHSTQFPSIVATTSLPRSVALADWRRQSAQLIAVGIVALLAFLAAGFLLVRYRRSRLSAERNELLIQEVQHRIRNNLQILLGLVRLRAAAAKEDETKEVLQRMGGDLSAVADAFALLNRKAGSRGKIDLCELLGSLCHSLSTALGQMVTFTHEAEIVLPAEDAMNIAIVANELITNAVKHGRGSPIILTCEATADSYSISVLGGAPDTNASRSESNGFGLMMANRLVAGLGGELTTAASDMTGTQGLEIRLPRLRSSRLEETQA